MTSPAAEPEDELTIRRTERADLLAIMRIENASFPQPWPYEAFEGFLTEPGFLVATDSTGRIAGYVVADLSPNYGRETGHIKDIAVHPDRRGNGVGSALLARALEVLAARGAHSVKLEVRRSNDAAQRLYHGFGFDSLRRIPGYYDDGEDALVMIRAVQ